MISKHLARTLLVAVVVAGLPLGAVAERDAGLLPTAPSAVAGPTGHCQPAGAAIGHVISVGGDAIAQSRDGCRRHLVCGDVVHEGEALLTGPDAHLRVIADDVIVKLDSGSFLALGRGEAGTVRFGLERGHVRLIDTLLESRDGGFALATPHARAPLGGGDTEAFVPADESRSSSVVCAWQRPLRLLALRGGEQMFADPGECVVARAGAPMSKASGEPEAFDEGELACPVVALEALFRPHEVAAALPAMGLAPPGAGSSRILGSCDLGPCGGDPNPVPDPGPDPDPDPDPTLTTDVIESPAAPITLF